MSSSQADQAQGQGLGSGQFMSGQKFYREIGSVMGWPTTTVIGWPQNSYGVGGWANPLQTLSLGLVLTIRLTFGPELDNNLGSCSCVDCDD